MADGGPLREELLPNEMGSSTHLGAAPHGLSRRQRTPLAQAGEHLARSPLPTPCFLGNSVHRAVLRPPTLCPGGSYTYVNGFGTFRRPSKRAKVE